MIERIIFLTGTILLLMAIFATVKRQQLKSARTAAAASNVSALNAKPQVVYFWSTGCSQCIAVQTPVIDNLARVAGKDNLTVRKFNVGESLDQANNWGVKTVPTTFVLDKDGTVQHVNNGLVTEKVLVEQIEVLSVSRH